MNLRSHIIQFTPSKGGSPLQKYMPQDVGRFEWDSLHAFILEAFPNIYLPSEGNIFLK